MVLLVDNQDDALAMKILELIDPLEAQKFLDHRMLRVISFKNVISESCRPLADLPTNVIPFPSRPQPVT
jgi:hypothetical protein